MQRHHYDTKYIVKSHYGEFGNTDDLTNARVVPVYYLLEVNIDNKQNKGVSQILVIEPNKWKSIALTYVSKNNLSELLKLGAELIDKPKVFKDEIDAKIQLAYVCAKHLIEQDDVYRVTEGQMSPISYGQLVEHMYKHFPEKFV